MNMNKRFLLFLSYALITIQSFAATVDTLYYDDKWKGVETPQFASYMRILYYPSDSNMPKKVKDFYITENFKEKVILSLSTSTMTVSLFLMEIIKPIIKVESFMLVLITQMVF